MKKSFKDASNSLNVKKKIDKILQRIEKLVNEQLESESDSGWNEKKIAHRQDDGKQIQSYYLMKRKELYRKDISCTLGDKEVDIIEKTMKTEVHINAQ
ncbi:hypothetical protein Tco_0807509 [Tanacetum coccineum]